MQPSTGYAVAALLTWIAGFVDAVGFISLARVYTANMSGNSVAVGIQLASRNWLELVRRGWPVFIYFIALVFSRGLIQVGARRRIRSIASVAFGCEIALLVPACLSRQHNTQVPVRLFLIYVALLAFAMGIQSAALTRFSSVTIHTGFVTGTLVKCAEQSTKYLTWLFDEIRSRKRDIAAILASSVEQKPFRLAVWLAATWIAYVVGAVCGALGDYRFNMHSLIVPIAGLAFLALLDLHTPLAISEEKEQANLSSQRPSEPNHTRE